MYKTSTELKREFAIGHLIRIQQNLNNLDDVSKINDVISILRHPHDTGQWIERKLIDVGGRTVIVHECSNCHYGFKDIKYFQYCPYCGSFMMDKHLEDERE